MAVDDKVVAMSFESGKFESGVRNTISALDKLKAALKFDGAGKGLSDIDSAAKRVDLSHIARGVDSIKQKLGFMSVAALAIFAQMAQRAVAAGARIVKAFTLDPVIAGFQEYQTNLNAVQTILANTAQAGTDLKDVNAALLELNRYSDKTIYNFSQMAKNIGTFTAAGVDLKTATGAIKGIANLAALSGSNAEQASTAMYQLSQAIAAGRVSLQDWNSVVNAGMGGTVFQRALANTAVAMGTLKENAVKLTGPMKNVSISGQSFRESISAAPGKKSWLTSGVLTATLKQFTGDMSAAELKAQGFNAAQIKAIQAQATMAMKAATEVKTLTGVLDTAKETAASGWAQTWQIIFGDFGEAKTLFTGLSNSINGFINASSQARNKVLGDWKALGGRTVLISALKTAFQNLGAILKPIKDAFRDIFPAKTGKDLYELTLGFKRFAEAMKPSPETVDNLHRTFRGLFAVLDIGKQIISGVFTMFGKLFGAVGAGEGGFLNLTGNIGDFLVSVDQALKKGGRLRNFFATIGNVLAAPIELLGKLRDALADLFGGFSSGGFSDQMEGVTETLSPFQRVMEGISNAWTNFLNALNNTGKIIQPIMQGLAEAFQSLGPAINDAIKGMNFQAILAVIRTGLLAGIFLLFKNFFGKGTLLEQVSKGFGQGILANISGSFSALQGSMMALQTNIKAKTLKEIAIAIALLTASVVALSFVDPKKLNTALTALAVGFGELIGALLILDKAVSSGGFAKLPFVTGSLILLAGALGLLTLSVLALSRLSWEELIKGLGGVSVLLVGISLASGPLSKNSAGMVRAGAGITVMAVGLRILANAVAAFGRMSWTELTKGLSGAAIGLTAVALAAKLMPANMIITGTGLIAVAVGLRLLANAVSKFGEMDWREMGKGMAGIAGSLVVIAGAMRLMPMNMVVTSAGLFLVAASLGRITKAVGAMGKMSITQLAKGLISLAAALTILAVGLQAMSGSVAGAAALGVAAAGIALLAPALTLLGKQSWTQIIKGLAALAGVFIAVGAAGMLLAPVVPALLGFGAALVLVGAGLALAGAGIAGIGIGLSAIAVAGPTAIGILQQAFVQFTRGLIVNAKLIVTAVLEIVRAFADAAPQFVQAMIKIGNALIDGLIQMAPKLPPLMYALITALLTTLRQNQGRVIQAGFDLLIALLLGIKNNLSQIVKMAADIVVNLLKGIANNITRVISAGVSIITKFLGGIAQGVTKVIAAGANIIVHFVTGMANNAGKIVTAATTAIAKFIAAIASNAVRLADAGATAMINFLNGIAKTIRSREPELMQAGVNIGVAIVEGMIIGLGQLAGKLLAKAESLAQSLIDKLKKPWKMFSPSLVAIEIGRNIVEGIGKGMDDHSKVLASAEALSYGVINAVKSVFQMSSPSKVMQDLGRYVMQGFAEGLRGSVSDINQVFTELNQKLIDAMTTARQTIAEEKAKLKELLAEKTKDKAAIAEAQKIIAQNEAILARSIAAHNLLTGALQKQKAQLIGLVKQYVAVADKLEKANQVLADAKQKLSDARSEYEGEYGELPPITNAENEVVTVAAYQDSLKAQAEAVASYNDTLQKLRALGLDDATYKMLLAKGLEGKAFAEELLAGGQTAVDGVNTLDAQLLAESKKLADNAAKNLYQAGVDAAQGIVDGLKSKESALRKAMERIATAMIKAIKKKLKIQSPSEIFAQVGDLTLEGMKEGLIRSSKNVTKALDAVTSDALASMQKSMRNVSNMISKEIDPSPTIQPILDLSQIQSKAGAIASLLGASSITPTVSLQQATSISAEERARLEGVTAQKETSIKFEQNNYSPEALTEIEIYRQTKNQLSQLKSALAL